MRRWSLRPWSYMGDTKAVGRIGGKAMLWFVTAALVSLLLGLIIVNILRPGDNLDLPISPQLEQIFRIEGVPD
jgi:Na+/H+-dicarboxylate symporter